MKFFVCKTGGCQPQESKKFFSGEKKICPNCNQPLQEVPCITLCPGCGIIYEPQNQDDELRCPECGFAFRKKEDIEPVGLEILFEDGTSITQTGKMDTMKFLLVFPDGTKRIIFSGLNVRPKRQ